MRGRNNLAWLLLFAAATLCPGTARAQAWVQPSDGYYFKLSASYLSTKEEFDFRGERQRIFAQDTLRTDTSFRDITLNAYLEYGISNNLTLVATLPFKILTGKETSLPRDIGFPAVRTERTNGGLADLSVGLRTPIVREPFALAIQGGIKLPLGYEKEPDNEGPPLGSGEVDIDGQVTIGRSLYPLPAYVSGGIGYRIRGGALHDEFLYSVEGGYTLGALFVKLRFDGLQNAQVNPPDITGTSSDVNDAIVGDQDIFKLSPAVTYRVDDGFAVTAEAFHTLAGKDTVTGTVLSLGVVFTH